MHIDSECTEPISITCLQMSITKCRARNQSGDDLLPKPAAEGNARAAGPDQRAAFTPAYGQTVSTTEKGVLMRRRGFLVASECCESIKIRHSRRSGQTGDRTRFHKAKRSSR